jgi:hypothetical protein
MNRERLELLRNQVLSGCSPWWHRRLIDALLEPDAAPEPNYRLYLGPAVSASQPAPGEVDAAVKSEKPAQGRTEVRDLLLTAADILDDIDSEGAEHEIMHALSAVRRAIVLLDDEEAGR